MWFKDAVIIAVITLAILLLSQKIGELEHRIDALETEPNKTISIVVSKKDGKYRVVDVFNELESK